jgi:hypothetical protein
LSGTVARGCQWRSRPESSKAGNSQHPLQVKIMRGLSLDEANTIIAASFAAAKKHNCRPMSAIVLDAGGRVKAFQKQDGASMLRRQP